jgi:hypothetical protein
MAEGIGFFVGLVLAGIVLLVAFVGGIFSPWLGAVGYVTAVYVLFAIMVISSWSVRVRKSIAWEDLSQLEQYVLHRHRAFFYFPFGASNFGHFCNWTRLFAVLWAVFCVWKGWYLLAGALAFFYVVSTPMITIWIPVPVYQTAVQRGHKWAEQRLKAMQHVLEERDALGF